MIIKLHIRTKQNTEIFCRVTWRDDVRVKINVNYLQINMSIIKKKIFCLLGLVDNLLATNQEKTSLMQDLIIDTADNA